MTVYNFFFADEPEPVHDYHPETPDHMQLLMVLLTLEEEVQIMSIALDALMDAIDENSMKVDELIAKMGSGGGGGDAEGATEAEVNAALDAVKANNDKIEAKLAEILDEPVPAPAEEVVGEIGILPGEDVATPVELPAPGEVGPVVEPVGGIPGGTNF